MTEFKSVSLASQVFERLEEDIITGVYPRGEVLTPSCSTSFSSVRISPLG